MSILKVSIVIAAAAVLAVALEPRAVDMEGIPAEPNGGRITMKYPSAITYTTPPGTKYVTVTTTGAGGSGVGSGLIVVTERY